MKVMKTYFRRDLSDMGNFVEWLLAVGVDFVLVRRVMLSEREDMADQGGREAWERHWRIDVQIEGEEVDDDAR